ncbi:uncharacterized protein [Arachis hypogaea]|uniref:uncharacterized protein isoform X2 n=1 Tax=Arachis hypogaea TaxID=3818 RepID=UPI000DECB283|nr:uncharacterized protein LOC112727595 isoform X2 [Arachis hypogaea]
MENLLVSRKITPIYLNSKIVSRAAPDFEDEEDEEEEKEGKILAPVPDSSFNEDNLFDESMSLKQLGFSDACLATLASGDDCCKFLIS